MAPSVGNRTKVKIPSEIKQPLIGTAGWNPMALWGMKIGAYLWQLKEPGCDIILGEIEYTLLGFFKF